MKYWIPGYWEWANRRHVQGILLFTLVPSSFLYILNLTFFSEIPDPKGFSVGCGLLFICALWHGMFVVITQTQATLTGGSFNEMYEKARLASLKGNTDLALFYFERMHQKMPEDEDVTYQLGKVYLETGKIGQAKKIFQKYLSKPDGKWKNEVEDLMEDGAKT